MLITLNLNWSLLFVVTPNTKLHSCTLQHDCFGLVRADSLLLLFVLIPDIMLVCSFPLLGVFSFLPPLTSFSRASLCHLLQEVLFDYSSLYLPLILDRSLEYQRTQILYIYVNVVLTGAAFLKCLSEVIMNTWILCMRICTF